MDLSSILTPLTCNSDCDEVTWTVGFGPDNIFANDLESGNLAGWSAVVQ